jgi:hypothetical protein
VTRFEAWLLHLSNLLVGATGLLYAWLRFVAEPPDPFAVAHPWLAPVQHAHVWTAPLLVFAVGAIWRSHALAGVRLGARPRRSSGLALFAGFVPMAASGYLLQTAVDAGWRKAWLIVHLAASAAWLVATVAHQLARTTRPGGAEPAP